MPLKIVRPKFSEELLGVSMLAVLPPHLKQSLVLVESFSLCQNLAEQCEQGKVIEPSECTSKILSWISHAGAERAEL